MMDIPIDNRLNSAGDNNTNSSMSSILLYASSVMDLYELDFITTVIELAQICYSAQITHLPNKEIKWNITSIYLFY